MKNKKLALSVLSTAVVGSMASSAFALEPGIYIGGSADKHYSIAGFLNQLEQDQNFLDGVVNPNLSKVVYVDPSKKGVNLLEFIQGSEDDLNEALKNLTAADFDAETYTLENGQSWKASEDQDLQPAPAGELKVESVSANNLRTITVKFTKEVEAGTGAGGAELATNYTLTDATGAAVPVVPTLGADKKTVTLTIAAGLTNNTTYRLQINNIVDLAGNEVETYDQLLPVADSTAPTLVDTKLTAGNNTFVLNFSEPLANIAGKVKVYDSKGVDVTTSAATNPSLTNSDKSISIDTTNLTADETYRVVVLGATDLANNYFVNNKVEVTFKMAKTEEVKPTVTSVTAKNQQEIRVVFSEPILVASGTSKIGEISVDGEDLTGTPGGAVVTDITAVASADFDAAGEAVDVNGDGKTWDIKLATSDLTGAKKIGLVNFVDLQGNTQSTKFEQFVTFAADQTAPALVSSKVEGSKLYITFDEDIAIADGTATLLAPNNVEKTVTLDATGGTPNFTIKANDSKTAVIDLGANVATPGTYKLSIPANVVTDLAGTPNTQAYEVTATFTTAADTVKPTLLMNGTSVHNNAIVQTAGNPSEFVITFSEKLDSSALNVANYKIDGVAAFEKAVFVDDTDKVKLTLKPDAIETTGTHLFTISGIKDLAGNTMETVTYAENAPVVENTTPKLTAASLTTASTIALTFSEALGAGEDAQADFEVYVGGVKATISGYNATTKVITLSAPADITKDIKVKVVGDIADAVGNKVAKAEYTVAK